MMFFCYHRPDAVSLVDAFDLHDDSISSILGVHDGNVYERLYESAKYNPMNQSQVKLLYSEKVKQFSLIWKLED